MAREKSLKQILAELEPGVRLAFERSVQQLKSDISVAEVARRIERGDIDGALQALHLDADAFDQLADALRAAYNAGGIAAVAALPVIRDAAGARVPIRWGGHNPESAAKIAANSSNLITEILEGPREAIRGVLTEGYRAGRNPRKVALEIVGRIGPKGRRTGGLIGLHSQQVEWVTTARAELLSGDPAMMRNYLRRAARDKRFDARVARAIAEGGKLKVSDVDRMVARYSDKLLKVRGDTIARTETLNSMRAATYEAIQQQIDKGNLTADQVQLTWDSAEDSATRDSHREMDGQTVQWGQPFTTPTGYSLRFPGDSSLGAPGSEIINCRCRLAISVNRIRGLRDSLTPDELAQVRAAMAEA